MPSPTPAEALDTARVIGGNLDLWFGGEDKKLDEGIKKLLDAVVPALRDTEDALVAWASGIDPNTSLANHREV
jgi:hypothetical protein